MLMVFFRNPSKSKKALSDGNTMLKLNQLKKMLKKFVAIKKAISKNLFSNHHKQEIHF